MTGRILPTTIALAAVLCIAASLGPAAAQAVTYGTNDVLFYNYYVPPGAYGTVAAPLYLSPRPTPAVVGHTYITYQPLMPQELLYPHSRRTWTYHPEDCNWTRTVVTYHENLLDLVGLKRLLHIWPQPRAPLPSPSSILDPLLGTVRY